MANSTIVEVFGPIDRVQPTVEGLASVQTAVVNRVGCLVLDMGDWSVTLGNEYDDTSTLLLVNGAASDQAGVQLFGMLEAVLPYAVEVRSADASDVLASRAARSAA